MAKKRNPTADQAKRFVAIKDRLQASTGLAAHDVRLAYLAACHLRVEQLTVRVIAGDDSVTLGELQAMRTQIEEMTPPPPCEVKLTIVRAQRCEFCVERTIASVGPSTVEQASVARSDVHQPAAPAANVVPIAPRRVGGIHDAVLPDGTPARMRRNDDDSFGYAHTAFGPGVLSEPNPFSIYAPYGHRLPDGGG